MAQRILALGACLMGLTCANTLTEQVMRIAAAEAGSH